MDVTVIKQKDILNHTPYIAFYVQQPQLPIILGSSSIYRSQILASLGYSFTTMLPIIDKETIKDPDPTKLSLMIANAKAESLLSKIPEPSILITASQVIACNGEIREKPKNIGILNSYIVFNQN